MSSIPPKTIECFDEQMLRDFNLGRITDTVLEERVANHLTDCETCESRLESIDDSEDPILELLRSPQTAWEGSAGPHPVDLSGAPWFESTFSLRADASESTKSRVRLAVDTLGEELPLRIDRYFVIRRLGSGSFGEVFLAKGPESERLVAIKIPSDSYTGSKSLREAFLREARTAAALSHPHIVPVYDCRELADGRCIVVMKYIEGRTLQQRMRSERIDSQRAVELIATIAEALDYAHQRGIRHRDVKPANVLLDVNDRPYLTDFGLAIHEQQQHLHANELAGTYAFMSPEQIRGDSHRLDGRSDIWSLGVVLYEMLTGERPFRGQSRQELRDAILNQHPKLLRQYEATIGRRLERMCLKCLMKNPADRFATAAELAQALRRRPRRMIRTASWAALASVVVLTVIVAAAVSRNPSESAMGPEHSAGEVARQAVLKPLAWPVLEPTDYYELEPKSGRIAVKSSAFFSSFETHEPTSTHYFLETSADIRSQAGRAGLALGIHETSQHPLQYRCVIVFISKNLPSAGTWVTVEDCDIGMNEIRHMDFRLRRGVVDKQLDRHVAANTRLGIEVRDQRIVNVVYNGQPLPEITAALGNLNINRNTRCGIMAQSHVVFHSVSCKELPE